MNQLTPEIADEFERIMKRKGMKAAYEYLESLHIKHKAVKSLTPTDLDGLLGMTGATDTLQTLIAAIMRTSGLKDKAKAVQEAFQFLIEDPTARIEAKRAALAVNPPLHQFLLNKIQFDPLEAVYDIALSELMHDATPSQAQPSGGTRSDSNQSGKAHPTRLDPTWGLAIKEMSSADQDELNRRKYEAIGLTEYLQSGLSKVLGSNWESLLNGIEYAWSGLKLKP